MQNFGRICEDFESWILWKHYVGFQPVQKRSGKSNFLKFCKLLSETCKMFKISRQGYKKKFGFRKFDRNTHVRKVSLFYYLGQNKTVEHRVCYDRNQSFKLFEQSKAANDAPPGNNEKKKDLNEGAATRSVSVNRSHSSRQQKYTNPRHQHSPLPEAVQEVQPPRRQEASEQAVQVEPRNVATSTVGRQIVDELGTKTKPTTSFAIKTGVKNV